MNNPLPSHPAANQNSQAGELFRKQKYINLATYRKNGEIVPTPVWFVEEGGVLYVRTGANSGKVKRIRNRSTVQVAPCDMRGKLKGKWVEAQACVADEATARHVNNLLKQKYGLQKKMFDWFGERSNAAEATLMIDVCSRNSY